LFCDCEKRRLVFTQQTMALQYDSDLIIIFIIETIGLAMVKYMELIAIRCVWWELRNWVVLNFGVFCFCGLRRSSVECKTNDPFFIGVPK
jgi:hypothetical protein